MFSIIIAFSAVECVIYSRKGMVADKMDENEHIFFRALNQSQIVKESVRETTRFIPKVAEGAERQYEVDQHQTQVEGYNSLR